MRVAIASFRGVPPEFTDDDRLIAALAAAGVEAQRIAWDESGVDWEVFDGVVIRSTWDYDSRRGEFVTWAERVGERLHNSPAVIRWNSDKRYLGDLGAEGIPTVATTYIEPGDPVPAMRGEVVVKPSVSGGGRDTGRFTPSVHDQARDLIAAINASGRTAMVQSYLATVDTVGETAIVCLNGEFSHVLRKRAVLRPDEVAPVRDDGLGAAEVMYDPQLVTAGQSTAAELALAERIVAHVSERFDYVPLYARVDMLTDDSGAPVLLELEAVEPNLYLDQSEGAAARTAAAIAARLTADR